MSWKELTRRKKKAPEGIRIAANSDGLVREATAGMVDRFLRNASAKAVTLRRSSDFAKASKAKALAEASRIDLFAARRKPIGWNLVEKPSGGHRTVCNLPVYMRVGQTMAKEVIHAQHHPKQHIFDWPDRGGCPGAVAAARTAIQDHGRYVVVADIVDCYSSFNPEYIYQTNLLPAEFVRAALDSTQYRFAYRGDTPLYDMGYTEQTCPRGLLQGGAASSALLAVALDDLPDHLPNGVVPICQSDNIMIVCRSAVECDAAADALVRYLRDNPAGTFSPRLEKYWLRTLSEDARDPQSASWERRFEEFGYTFQLNDHDECQVGLSHSNLIKVARRFVDYLDNLPPYQSPILAFDAEMTERLAGFPALTSDQRRFLHELLEPDFTLKFLRLSPLAREEHDEEDSSVPWNEN